MGKRILSEETRKTLLDNFEKNGGVVKPCVIPPLPRDQKMPHEELIEKGKKILTNIFYR